MVAVPDAGVPKTGVTSVGLVAKTNEPVPVSSVTAVRRFAELGVPKNVPTPGPNSAVVRASESMACFTRQGEKILPVVTVPASASA